MSTRSCYVRDPVEGFRGQKVESLAFSPLSQGAGVTGGRLFAGSSLGELQLYEVTRGSGSCVLVETIRKAPKDRKPVSQLTCVDSWRVVIGIMDGMVMAYDSQTLQLLSQLLDTKGCHLFAVQERSSLLVVANKKKISIYQWQDSGIVPKREMVTPEVPKSLLCVSGAIIVGYKKGYDVIDLQDVSSSATNTMTASRLIDFDKEHRNVCLEIAGVPGRPPSALLSVGAGLQGAMLDMTSFASHFPGGAAGNCSFSAGAAAAHGHGGAHSSSLYSQAKSSSFMGDRIEWSAPPLSLHLLVPFIVTLTLDSVCEVHDLTSLGRLQKVTLSMPPSTAAGGVCLAGAARWGDVFLCHGNVDNQLFTLRMVPIAEQVAALMDAKGYEEAISLCAISSNTEAAAHGAGRLRESDIADIHEKYAAALLSKGDFEGAMTNYIAAKTAPITIIRKFPDLIPTALHAGAGIGIGIGIGVGTGIGIGIGSGFSSAGAAAAGAAGGVGGGGGGTQKLTGMVLQRAAAALATFCSFHRAAVSTAADRIAPPSSSSSSSSSSSQQQQQHQQHLQDHTHSDSALPLPLSLSELLDTALLFSLVSCSPPRRSAVVDLLSSKNRCHMESSAVLLASQGNAFTEPLLWLYRSRHEHRRVLAALTEERCVGGGGSWSKDQFYSWTAEYLRWLWYQDVDALPQLALSALRPVLEYDAGLGLSVLTVRPSAGAGTGAVAGAGAGAGSGTAGSGTGGAGAGAGSITGAGTATGSTAFGGRGVTVQEIVSFLESVQPSTLSARFNSGTDSLAAQRSFDSKAARRASVAAQRSAAGAAGAGSGVSGAGAGGGAGGVGGAGAGLGSGSASGFGGDVAIPLINGRALGVSYLEWLVSSGKAPRSMHDEFAQLLIEGIPVDKDTDHRANDLEFNEGDTEAVLLYKIYRRKLQSFLMVSTEYRPERVLKMLPQQFLHEYALLLSRLQRHEEALRVYVEQVGDVALAEQYCRRTCDKAPGVYLMLVEALLAGAGQGLGQGQSGAAGGAKPASAASVPAPAPAVSTVTTVIQLAERNYDKIDSATFLGMLPQTVPLSQLTRYLSVVVEHNSTRKRNLQILHQLLRVREVALRTSPDA